MEGNIINLSIDEILYFSELLIFLFRLKAALRFCCRSVISIFYDMKLIVYGTVLLYLGLYQSSQCSKILVYAPRSGYSHVSYAGRLADVLTEAGHDVVCYSAFCICAKGYYDKNEWVYANFKEN